MNPVMKLNSKQTNKSRNILIINEPLFISSMFEKGILFLDELLNSTDRIVGYDYLRGY